MRKALSLLLLLAVIPVAYFGVRDLLTASITKAGVSKSTGFGKVNPDHLAMFEDRPTLRLFERALAKAEKFPGIADVADPHFDVELLYSNGRVRGLHLWLIPEGVAGSIMDVTNTGTIYELPRDIVADLIALLEPYAEQAKDGERDSAQAEMPALPTEEPDLADGEPPAIPVDDPDAGEPPACRDASVFSLVAGDIPISIGAWDNEIDLEALLGRPVAQTVEALENADTHTGSYVKKMSYAGLELELFSPKQNGETFWIMSIGLTGNGYRTTREIAVGSTLEELLLSCPEIGMVQDGRTDTGNAAYEMSDELNERFLRFEVADGRVAEIRVYRMLP